MSTPTHTSVQASAHTSLQASAHASAQATPTSAQTSAHASARAATHASAQASARASVQATRASVQRALADDWAMLLGLDAVGPDDDFFEAGGHSLVAVQIVARIRARHGVEVPVADVFTYPTVGELAEVVAGMLEAGTSLPSLPSLAPLSPLEVEGAGRSA
ncbi:phosphopantetheine-binding protein [Streptosporangium sp. NPDC002524]|uniref:acyl carrier protein n=1 Tax=Streptosporangium sp. NPDC002524 TaxID=3154537 RepID=UPI003325F531